MEALAPLSVAVPLLGAAVLPGVGLSGRRRLVEWTALAFGLASLSVCILLLREAMQQTFVYWFGGWETAGGVALGIPFTVDALGAGLAALSGGLVVASFVFSWRYFEAVGVLFHVLLLVFLAGMVGLCLTGDLFNLFVFFEVMTVAAYALCGYQTEETGPLQGALNFAVTNSVGATMILLGVAVLYGETGALNLAELGRHLAVAGGGPAVVVAFLLVTVGFLVKAAIVPFHFWMADAYASAPTPVCILLTGVMSELGLFAWARVYWTVFSDAAALDPSVLSDVLVAAGGVTALVGAVMCLAQDRLKRMLAFATVAHAGLILVGAALLDSHGTAGWALYMVADGLLKASLFMGVGIVQHRLADVDENRLRGRGRDFLGTAALFALGGLALSGLPPFGPFLGKASIEEAALAAGYTWVAPLLLVVSAVTGGAVLRATARVFAGWGPQEKSDRWQSPAGDEEEPETIEGRDTTPPTMYAPALVALALALAVGIVPQVADRIQAGAESFVDRHAYERSVLQGAAVAISSVSHKDPKKSSLVLGVASALGAVLVAAGALQRRRFPRVAADACRKVFGGPLDWLRGLHSGKVGDYVAWLTGGAAMLGALFAALLRP
jgi:multicomponent Na+:H+ antiporter subunit D